MNREFVNRAPERARADHARTLGARRQTQRDDALDFLVNGDEDGRHKGTCVHALAGREPCSRDYDPLPYHEAAPADPWLYAGTGIGALYDLPGSECHAWQLAGWNVVPGSTR